MLNKKINRIVVYFSDGTYEEINNSYVMPPMPTPYPIYNNQCSRCGIKFDGAMGYVCGQIDCPSGLRSAT